MRTPDRRRPRFHHSQFPRIATEIIRIANAVIRIANAIIGCTLEHLSFKPGVGNTRVSVARRSFVSLVVEKRNRYGIRSSC